MSCYTRHLGDWLPPEPTWADRRALDAAVRAELGLTDADCPEVWAAVRTELEADRAFGDRVRSTPSSLSDAREGSVPRSASSSAGPGDP